MLSRNLGNNGPRVSALGLGCMGMTAFYSGRGSEQGNSANKLGRKQLHLTHIHTLDHHQVLLKAIELGCTFWDSADVYTTNEEMLASFFKANPGTREKVRSLLSVQCTEYTVCIP